MAPFPCTIASTLPLLLSLITAYTPLSSSSLKSIPDPGSDFDIEHGKILSPILQPRVPGTEGSTAVQQHIAGFFRNELPTWDISFQNSSSQIPFLQNKMVPFVNIIARRSPPWTQDGEVGYLTLVAHYDSKLSPEGFIGAIDSAAPCAMLMHAARALEPALTRKWDSMTKVGMKMEDYAGDVEEHMGLQILFLDGEEAFGDWSDADSIWGAKSLAEAMENEIHPALSTYKNQLTSIELFMLLDLLGDKGPLVPSYYKTTHWAYKHLHDIAVRLDEEGKSETKSVGQWLPDWKKSDETVWYGGGIGDDHLPFQERGVEVLHVIPSPFPIHLWHKIEDDGEHLDIPTCKDWAVLVTAFAAEWLDLEGFVNGHNKERGRKRDEL